jgi:hypothetical protein
MACALRQIGIDNAGANMSDRQRQTIYTALAILVVAGCVWAWFEFMEKQWIGIPKLSDEARQNPMLAATRLLNQHKYSVANVSTLAEAPLSSLQNGMVVIAENGGVITPEQSARLLSWVKRGNTLVIRPKWSGRVAEIACGMQDDKPPAPSTATPNSPDTNPISSHLGVESVSLVRHVKAAEDKAAAPTQKKEAEPPCLTRFTPSGSSYALQIDVDNVGLQSTERSMDALFSDDRQEAMRVYAEGSGHIVAIADNYFDNNHLASYDHAELLLTLAELNRNAKHVLIVQHLDMPKWYQALWRNFQAGIIGLGCGLLLLVWAGVRRFGPILPEPNLERRSLIEHIDASGRWLWKVPGGRDILLSAVRSSINKMLLRKAPALLRLPPSEQASQLARLCNLPGADVARALHQPAANHPIDFTRQIQTLQQLRKHYER